ncbi:MAG: AAA family ATPase [Butyrivibrio sp.]|nr:AAA family ATPase [Butyrivibrio sp.]
MVIKHLRVVNFMGYKGSVDFNIPKIAALVGKNGIGKTSILNAIRYALAGEEPDGSIINNDADEAMVAITLTDPADGSDIVFSRSKHRTKPSKFMVDGVKTTAAKLNEKIEDVCGIPIDKVKVLSSAEVVANMKPQEFSKFILDYIPEKIDIKFIVDNLDKTNPQILDCIDANLPAEDIDMADIDNFLDMLKSSRKDLKARIAEKKALYETKPKEKAAVKSEVEEKIALYTEVMNKREVLEVKKKAYQAAMENAKKQEEIISSLKAEYASISAERPNPAVKDALTEKVAKIEESRRNQNVQYAGMTSALKQLEVTLTALEKPICPISPLITCHTDKSVAKEEISESIEATKEGIKALDAEVKKTEEALSDVHKEIESYNRSKDMYERKVDLARRIKEIEDNKVEIPEKPEMDIPDDAGVEEELANCKKLLSLIEEYEQGVTILSNIAVMSEELETAEYLIKAFGEKGCVRVAIIAKYVKVFEELINERSKKIRSDVSFSIIPEDGIRILMDTGNGMLPYENLSGGEKAYMLFMIMDMLNSLSGTRILFIDELSVMDAENFNALLDIIQAYQSEYDHVVFAAVDHKESVDAIKAHSIPIVDIVKGEVSAA